MVLFVVDLRDETSFLVDAGGTNTGSWSVSFAPRLERVASRRVAQHPAGYHGDPSVMARPAHRQPHPIMPTLYLLIPTTHLV